MNDRHHSRSLVGDEMQKILESGGRQLPNYQGNDTWVLANSSDICHCQGRQLSPLALSTKRMAIEDLLKALQDAQLQGEGGKKA